MDYLATHNTGSDQIISNIINYLLKLDNEERNFATQILTKKITCGVAAKTANKIYGTGFVPSFECMLAEKYFECPQFIENKDFSVTLKLDGIRCIAIKENGIVTLFSRQGQTIEGLIDIEKDLILCAQDNFMLDGELLICDTNGVASKEQYKETIKIVRKDGEKHNIIYHTFDTLSCDEFKNQSTTTPYIKRRNILNCNFGNMEFVDVLPVMYSGSNSQEILSLLDEVRSNEQEGIMLNINSAPYEFKRTKSLLKCKVMNECDLEIIGFEEGNGRLSGTLGRINVNYKGNTLGVGGGFSDEEREYFWMHQKELLARVVTIQYFEETKNADGQVSLRFPVFLELREKGKCVNY